MNKQKKGWVLRSIGVLAIFVGLASVLLLVGVPALKNALPPEVVLVAPVPEEYQGCSVHPEETAFGAVTFSIYCEGEQPSYVEELVSLDVSPDTSLPLWQQALVPLYYGTAHVEMDTVSYRETHVILPQLLYIWAFPLVAGMLGVTLAGLIVDGFLTARRQYD